MSNVHTHTHTISLIFLFKPCLVPYLLHYCIMFSSERKKNCQMYLHSHTHHSHFPIFSFKQYSAYSAHRNATGRRKNKWTLNIEFTFKNTSYELLNIILLALNFPVHNYFIITKVVSWCNRNNEVKLTWSLLKSLFKYMYKTSMIHYRLANRSVSSFHKNK